jgi:hypothetical protein
VKAAEAVAIDGGGFCAVVVCDVPIGVAIERCERDAASGAHLAGNRNGDLVRRVAAEMEEPPGDYLTVSMTEDVETVVGHVLAYVDDCAQ